ncbi:class F sortase [Actinoplanes aureus]|uniref:Class F sortase n=1 Tax=Actinoplanes aureus TaxID=2792083 RepID=A0A931G1X5_9ACTN|nr:class F sortase [Actinoplanes aureus]MBG0567117.1 class F sortase [Actinoplanes aureus]
MSGPAYLRGLLLLALVAGGLAGLAGAQPSGALSAPGPEPAPQVTGPIAADRFRSESDYAEVALPVRLRIPELRVQSELERLGLQSDGAVAVPKDPHVAGWYEHGPRPGQPGPAVILGHVDSKAGPGIFASLAGAPVGTQVRVDRADGSTVTFRITRISRVPKDEFPTDLVYAPTLDATLRLVTCGGGFDRSRGSYRDNVIAYAEPV